MYLFSFNRRGRRSYIFVSGNMELRIYCLSRQNVFNSSCSLTIFLTSFSAPMYPSKEKEMILVYIVVAVPLQLRHVRNISRPGGWIILYTGKLKRDLIMYRDYQNHCINQEIGPQLKLESPCAPFIGYVRLLQLATWHAQRQIMIT